MFLNQLNDQEKEAFVNLSIYAAESNGIIVEAESLLFHAYAKEMELYCIDLEKNQTMDEVVSVFNLSSKRVKKIVLLETLGMLLIDGTFDIKEKGFINDFVERIGLTKEEIEIQLGLLKEYIEVMGKIMSSLD